VGDQDEAGVVVCCFQQELDDLGLCEHVQRCRRLVSNDKIGITGQRHGDQNTLAHPTRVLMGVVVNPIVRVGNPDVREQVPGALVTLAISNPDVVLTHRLHDLFANRLHWVERGEGILWDPRDLAPTDLRHLLVVLIEQFGSFPPNRTRLGDNTGALDELEDR
jgi:hypothetical protein